AGFDGLRQFRLRLGRVAEAQVAEADGVMRVGRMEARRLRLAPAASAATTNFGERTLAGIHQALEHRFGLVGLAELLETQRLVVGLSAAACGGRHSAATASPGWRRSL